jgi:hypothetical protein
VRTARLHRHLSTGLALVAMLAFALLPALSRAMAGAAADAAWTPVCTSDGMRWMSRAADPGPASTAVHLDRCALCALTADGAAPLPVQAAALRLRPQVGETPLPHATALRARHAWPAAQPRGPPLRA